MRELLAKFYRHRDSLKALFLESWHPYAWIALTGLIAYAHTVGFDFTWFDDQGLILANADFLQRMRNIPRTFTENCFSVLHGSNAYYRPLLFVSFIVDANLGGTAPGIYHLHNMLLHVVVSMLVYCLLIRHTSRRLMPFLMTLLFVVHPVLSQAVLWIPGRCDLLLAVFSLVCVLCFTEYVWTSLKRFYLGHLAALLLACLTKETALSLMPLCAAYSFLGLSQQRRDEHLRHCTIQASVVRVVGQCPWLEWAVIGFFWFVLRTSVLGGLSAQTSWVAIWRGFVSSVPGLVQMYGKMLIPANLNVFPSPKDTTLAYGIIALLITVVFVAWSCGFRRRLMIWGCLWFVAFLFPVFFGPVQRVSGDMRFLEHRLNLPLVGMMLTVMQMGPVRHLSKSPRLGLSVWFAVFLVFLLTLVLHSSAFRDPLSFWESAVRSSPDSPCARKNLAVTYHLKGLIRKAERAYDAAEKCENVEIDVHFGRALLHKKMGRLNLAEKDLIKEIELYPSNRKAYLLLGGVLKSTGRSEEAQYWLQRAPPPGSEGRCLQDGLGHTKPWRVEDF